MAVTTHKLSVPRTARYALLGEPGPETREVWFVFHGYGMLAERFIHKFIKLYQQQSHTVIVSPEGLSRYYLGENKWEHVGATWMTREDRLDEIRDQHSFLNPLYDQLLAPTQLDQLRVVHLGFSQGVATAWRWLEQNPHIRADGLILWAGMAPREAEGLVQRQQDGLPIQLVYGDKDPFINHQRKELLLKQFDQQGLSTQETEYPGDHRVDPDWVLKVRRHLLGAAKTT